MKAKKFFLKLNERNIHDAEYRQTNVNSLSLEVFNGELNNFTSNNNSSISVDAIIDGKLIMATTEDTSNKNIDKLIDEMIENAKYSGKKGAEIFKEKVRYKKFNYYNKELFNIPTQKKMDLIFLIGEKIKAFDPRIQEVQVSYEETLRTHEYQNTSGIKIKEKDNCFYVGAYLVIKEGNQAKTNFEIFIDNDFNKFNIDSFVIDACSKAINKLHPIQLTSKKYKVVFDPDVTSTLVECYISQLNAELVLKNSSWFKDKINTEVASKRVTIFESPLKKDSDFTNSDDQGVPTQNLNLIKKGVLLTYLHNLETAKKFNVAPNGHGTLMTNKIGIAAHDALHLKPGKLSKEELFNKVKDGIYINHFEGLHAGMNPQNGNFSLKCEGFMIKDGKLDKALDMMTINSNLFEIFKRVKAISQDIEYIKNGVKAPCIYLDKMTISF